MCCSFLKCYVMVLRVIALVLLSVNSIAQPRCIKSILIRGSAEIEKRSFLQKDTLFKDLDFELFIQGDSILYLSDDGFLANIDLGGALSGDKEIKEPLDLAPIRFLASDNWGWPLKDTSLSQSMDTHEFLDSGKLSLRVADTNVFYKTTFYRMGSVQILNVTHTVTSVTEVGPARTKAVVRDMIDSLISRYERQAGTDRKLSPATDKELLRQFENTRCLSELGAGTEARLIVFWYRGCAPCNLLMKELVDRKLNPEEVLFVNNIDALDDQKEYLKKMNSSYSFTTSNCFKPKSYPVVFLSKPDSGVSRAWSGYSPQIVEIILKSLQQ